MYIFQVIYNSVVSVQFQISAVTKTLNWIYTFTKGQTYTLSILYNLLTHSGNLNLWF